MTSAMTRTQARECAVMLCYNLSYFTVGACEAAEIVDDFFDPDYFDTLTAEDSVFEAPPNDAQLGYIKTVVCGVAEQLETLDAHISRYSQNWRVSRISRTASAVMRVAIFEMFNVDDVPCRAAINEAVEIAKGYETPETVGFVNGILGGVAGEFFNEDGTPIDPALTARTPEPEFNSLLDPEPEIRALLFPEPEPELIQEPEPELSAPSSPAAGPDA